MDNELEERSSLESILDYAQTLWRWAWLLLIVAIAAGAVAFYLTNQKPRVYESSTRAVVNVVTGSNFYDAYSASFGAQRLAETYSQTMITPELLQSVSERLGFEVTGKITVTPVENSPIFTIVVTDNDPQKAADTANMLITIFAEKVMKDQSSRYSELKQGLEEEIARIDQNLTDINERLAILQIKEAELAEAEKRAAQMAAEGLEPIEVVRDPNDYVTRAQLELAQSQYQSTRSSLFYNLQQIKLTEVQSATTISQIDKAMANPEPIQPQPFKSAGLAAIVGLMVAAGIVFLIAFLQDEIRDPEEFARRWGVPVVGVITHYPSNQDKLITVAKPRMSVSEAFRSLRTNLQFSGIDTPLKSVLVTSPSPSEGKSSVVANLATVIAQSEKEVVLVDGDLRRPTLHKVFKLSNRIGLSDYFIREPEKMSGVVKKTKVNGLNIISSGSLPPNPSELLGSTKMHDVLGLLEKHFDMVLLDSPPLLAVTDALILAKSVDGVLLVVDPKKTKRGAIRQAIEQLQRLDARLLGVILNNIKIKRSSYYYNRDYYYSKQYGKSNEDGTHEEPAVEEDKTR